MNPAFASLDDTISYLVTGDDEYLEVLPELGKTKANKTKELKSYHKAVLRLLWMEFKSSPLNPALGR